MEWQDEGIVLGARRHGESSAVVTLLTRAHGRHAGLVRGGASRRAQGLFQPGNRVTAVWRARLAEHLGSFRCEVEGQPAAVLMDDALRLAALAAACAVAEAVLPEREPHPAVFDGLTVLISALDGEGWGQVYVRWEIGLLQELGFGLDLATCAATGRNDDLAWVSPRTGRAVSLSAGEAWRDKLIPLPPFLAGRAGEAPAADIAAGLRLTGYFLDRHVLGPQGAALPAARGRLTDRLG